MCRQFIFLLKWQFIDFHFEMDRCPISRGLQLLNWDIDQHLMHAKYQQSTSLKAHEVAGIMEIGSNTLTVHGQPVQAVLQACRQESLAKE